MDTDYKGKDKILHFCVCAIIALYSTEAAIAAGVAKEYGDREAKGNHWCWWDLLADILGAAAGTAVRLAVSGRWNWI